MASRQELRTTLVAVILNELNNEEEYKRRKKLARRRRCWSEISIDVKKNKVILQISFTNYGMTRNNFCLLQDES